MSRRPRWFPHHSFGERVALAFLIPLVVFLVGILAVFADRADFPISLWLSTGGIASAAAGLGGVAASALVRRSLVDVSTAWIDAAGSLLTVAGAFLTFAGFWWSAKRPPENWELGAMPTSGFVALLLVLWIVATLVFFAAAGTGVRPSESLRRVGQPAVTPAD